MSGTSGAKEPRRRLSGSERRRAILDAGMRVFAERGYERASMREIARSAGITTPVIYDHFSSKRELQTALLGEQEAALRIHQGRERELEPGADLARALIDDFFSWVESHPYAWRMLFHDTPSDPQVLAAQRGAQRPPSARSPRSWRSHPSCTSRPGSGVMYWSAFSERASTRSSTPWRLGGGSTARSPASSS